MVKFFSIVCTIISYISIILSIKISNTHYLGDFVFNSLGLPFKFPLLRCLTIAIICMVISQKIYRKIDLKLYKRFIPLYAVLMIVSLIFDFIF